MKEEMINSIANDTRDWNVLKAQNDIRESGVDGDKIVPILYWYGPFLNMNNNQVL
jgi:hypothetical protein